MCGICTELRFDGQTPAAAPMQRMLDKLARRGPDDDGLHIAGPIALGHRRLAIIDLSARGHQPMLDPRTGNVLAFNGVIYNYRELRAQLQAKGHHFDSSSDTEVILKAYAEWGEHCPERLDGMFAFALWNAREQRLFLVRDRLGIKPLYYSCDNQRIRIASNTQALLAAGDVDTEIDPVALHHHLSLHAVVPAPRTLFKGIRKLPPATTLSIDIRGQQRQRCYWQLDATRPDKALDEKQWIEATHASLTQAVDKRIHAADVPVGVLLSGGLDSSLLVALLAEAGHADIRTFSVGFEDSLEESGSEFEYSDQVVEHFATRHHRWRIPNSAVLERLPEALTHMSEPMVGQDAVAFYLLGERVSQDIKVVLSGQGADEVFAGYFWYPQMQATAGSDLDRFRQHYFDRSHEELLSAINPRYHGADHTSELVRQRLALPRADRFMDRVLHMDVTMLITDDPVKRVDNMTMAWGLEARVPFLDYQLVELAAQMPPELKLKGGGKFPLKAISRGLLPDSVIDRPKGYFPMPALKYVRGDFLELMGDILNSRACRERGLFQSEHIAALLAAPESHLSPLRGNKLWHAALLEWWLQLNVDGH